MRTAGQTTSTTRACWSIANTRGFRFPNQSCGPILWPVHLIAFHLGRLPVHWYGVMVALGFMAGLWTASRRGLREGVAPEKVLDLGPWLILGTIVGARTLYVLSYWKEEFAGHPGRILKI